MRSHDVPETGPMNGVSASVTRGGTPVSTRTEHVAGTRTEHTAHTRTGRPAHTRRRSSGLLLALPLTLCLTALTGAGAAQAAGSGGGDPARELARVDQPLRSTAPDAPFDGDLRAFGRMVGAADVVGAGEATHGSAEFVTTKHRLFRYLVEHRNFRTFAFEIQWSAGLRLDRWVRTGDGDLATIMDEEFQNGGALWNTEEMADLFRWMRAWNEGHRDQLRVVGDDAAFAGPELFDRVTAYVARNYPALLPTVKQKYAASRPTAGMDETMTSRFAMPLAERRQLRDDVQSVLTLLERQRPGPDRRAHALVLQHARAIAQVGTLFGYDMVNDAPGAMRYRDEVMAANTVWWQRHSGTRVFLSAHNTHVGGESNVPDYYPTTQGEVLREELGKRYVNLGFTFGQGGFNAVDPEDPKKVYRPVELGPAAPNSSEHTLERVAKGDYYLDTRTAPRTARSWLTTARPVRSIGASWPADEYESTRLGHNYDIVVHLHRVTTTTPR
ncbi:erythromycin esterase family protein [Streptomyces sp. 796.1]|uniref:erythromycin esterase family protein n=1 Tax=Streptomyces sp. 796.1 TaxID=3163029 RepID=UPI0039C95E6F